MDKPVIKEQRVMACWDEFRDNLFLARFPLKCELTLFVMGSTFTRFQKNAKEIEKELVFIKKDLSAQIDNSSITPKEQKTALSKLERTVSQLLEICQEIKAQADNINQEKEQIEPNFLIMKRQRKHN